MHDHTAMLQTNQPWLERSLLVFTIEDSINRPPPSIPVWNIHFRFCCEEAVLSTHMAMASTAMEFSNDLW